MRIYDHSIHSYQEAADYLGNRQSRPLGHNTRLDRRDDGAIRVIYHLTPVVTYFPPGFAGPLPVTVLNSGGWYTYTTKERLNCFGPEGFRVWQEHREWFLYDMRDSRIAYPDSPRYPFANGITIRSDGLVVNAGPAR